MCNIYIFVTLKKWYFFGDVFSYRGEYEAMAMKQVLKEGKRGNRNWNLQVMLCKLQECFSIYAIALHFHFLAFCLYIYLPKHKVLSFQVSAPPKIPTYIHATIRAVKATNWILDTSDGSFSWCNPPYLVSASSPIIIKPAPKKVDVIGAPCKIKKIWR